MEAITFIDWFTITGIAIINVFLVWAYISLKRRLIELKEDLCAEVREMCAEVREVCAEVRELKMYLIRRREESEKSGQDIDYIRKTPGKNGRKS